MIYELSQHFIFEAAHTLNRHIDADRSRRIHGHTYHARVFVQGKPDVTSKMIVDIGLLRQEIDRVREMLDHRFLDEVEGLGVATLESLCDFIYNALSRCLPNVSRILVERPSSGDCCELIIHSSSMPRADRATRNAANQT